MIKEGSEYQAPKFLFNKHLETIYPALFRKVDLAAYKRERIELQDQDFLDLDWLVQSSEKLVILCHGLEGNSTRHYIKGMAKVFYEHDYDILALNYRGCSGESNRLNRFYNSGSTEDLDEVLQHVLKTRSYKKIFLIGFSLGGNLILKFLGEGKYSSAKRIQGAVAFSTPVDLYNSCLELLKASNKMYNQYFLRSLKKKIREKASQNGNLDLKGLKHIKSLIDFDDYYTAPLHGYRDARHYYSECNALQFLEHIQTPSLLVNAMNDPFLSETCYPTKAFKKHSWLTIETPQQGGHVGFTKFNRNNLFWSEERAFNFINLL
ncbi:MAG TPA: alpha/beta fold hydrolase [Cyclobacteriaceae bacterium]|nr:alpha/beta fold hydrolase [Cyclobacteriaceae bacterium]